MDGGLLRTAFDQVVRFAGRAYAAWQRCTACKYGLGLGVLACVIWRYWTPPPGSSGPGLADALANPVQVPPLLLAAVIFLAGLLVTFFRWFILVRAQGLPFTPLNALRLGLIGFFLSTFLPGSIGGDIVKAAVIAREQSRRTVAVATVLIDRAVGLWGIIWMVALLGSAFWLLSNPVLLANRDLRSLVASAVLVVGMTLVLCLILTVLPAWRAQRFAGRLSRLPRVGHAAAEFWRAVWMYRCQRAWVAAALLLSLVSQLCFVLAIYFAAQVFADPGEPAEIPSLSEHFLLVPVGVAWQALFPSPGGVGGAEAGFGYLYGLVGKPAALGALASLAQRVITWGLGLVGYLIYLRMRPALKPVLDEGADLAAAGHSEEATGQAPAACLRRQE